MRSKLRYRRSDSEWAQWLRERRRLELVQSREPQGVLLSRNYRPLIATLLLAGAVILIYGLTSSH